MHIKLDGRKMLTKEKAHKIIKDAFEFPDYYGNNLDALFDLLLCICKPLTIEIKNKEAIELHLKAYGTCLIHTFIEASQENDQIKVKIESSHSD